MTRRGAADLCAAGAAVIVLVIGGVTIVGDSDVLGPQSKTTVTKKAVPKATDSSKTTKTTTSPVPARKEKKGAKASGTTTTVETSSASPAKPAETTVTTQDGERTFAERVLGDGGIIALQLAAVLLAAFIAGAAVQRAILGEFGGFKIGSFELAAVANQTAAGIEGVDAKIDALKTELALALRNVDDARRDDAAGLKDDLALAYKRMALIEEQIGGS